MGGMVGAGFGGVVGTMYAVKYKTFSIIPVTMLGSGISMGFFMGMGMTIRGSGF